MSSPQVTTIRVKRGDIGIRFDDVLEDANGPVAIPVGATVLFLLRDKAGGVALISGTATVDDAPNGAVHYTTVAGNLDTVAKYHQEWEMTTSGGTQKLTFPSEGHNTIEVEDDLNPPP